jgi:hypothetical protein
MNLNLFSSNIHEQTYEPRVAISTSKWREVVKDGVAPDSCTAALVAFLQR